MAKVVEFAKKAHEGNPNDAKVKDFYKQVTQEHEGVIIIEETKEQKKPESTRTETPIEQ